MIIAARTGPPALPEKPKLNNNRYSNEQQPSQLQPYRQYHAQQHQYSSSSTSSLLSIDTANNNGNNKHPHMVTSPASMLHIPIMISRTTTGESSASTSSQNSSSTNSKQRGGWHLGSWFSNQQQQQLQQEQHENLKNSIRRPDSSSEISATLSPQVTGGGGSNSTTKRHKVIQELLETEKAFQKDMILLKEIYYDQATSCLTKSNVRHLFSNLLDIVEFEKTFVSLLEDSSEQDSVGTAFREMVRKKLFYQCIYAYSLSVT
jgi:hypothetical protein